MTTDELLREIEKAVKDKVTKLFLNNKGLTVLPPEIGQLVNLKELDLSYNQLNDLPVEIFRLVNLVNLNLNNNRLNALPETIRQLSDLMTFYVSNNLLTAIPPEIGQLKKLTNLDLTYNHLQGQLTSAIGHLPKLTNLFLKGNGLTALHPAIGTLTDLTTLYLSENQLITLPAEIGQLKELTTLDLENNQLAALPSEICQLTKLTEINLKGNQLTALPEEIDRLTKLKRLDIRNNKLKILLEILEKTEQPAVIINYYLQHQVGRKKPLNEVKLLLLGEGNVGKTSLVRRLVEDRFDDRENKTEGIDIKPWQITVNGQQIRLNVWDFGGQEIMHATHQFFLTKRSLYLLVLDARSGEQENRVEYWLKIIQSFAGGSPVIIVVNKIDQHPLDIDRVGLRAKYKSIKEFIGTSSLTGHGSYELKSIIAQEIGNLEHINDQLLLSWFAVKDKLENMKQDYIPYHEYVALCQAENITDELNQRTLIRFLHDLGTVLNFQDDSRLEDTNILNPEWVTNGVYKILNSNSLFQSNGVLERNMLNQILDPQRYPRDKHLFIIDMMRKFELCFDFEGLYDQKFLIPDLLSKEEPYTIDWQGALGFQYHYNVLPGSIISRFIVRMNARIYQNTYWRHGVVLAFEENKALVKADLEDKKIFIWIDGPQESQRSLLAIIRSEFEAIHATIPGISAEEKVPLPHDPNIVESYQYLLKLKEMNQESFIPEGPDKIAVNVKQLLGMIDDTARQSKPQKEQALDMGLSPTLIQSFNTRASISGILYLMMVVVVVLTFIVAKNFVPSYLLAIIAIFSFLSILILFILKLTNNWGLRTRVRAVHKKSSTH